MLRGQAGYADLPFDAWETVIDHYKEMHGLRSGKMLRKVARVSPQFADEARAHPDNNAPPI